MPVVYATRGTAAPLTLSLNDFHEPDFYSVDRTRALDVVRGLIQKHAVKLNGYGTHKQLVVDHLRGMVRIEHGDTPPIWKKITKEDHFFHALAYVYLAFRMRDVTMLNANTDLRTHMFITGTDVYAGAVKSLHSHGKRK